MTDVRDTDPTGNDFSWGCILSIAFCIAFWVGVGWLLLQVMR